MGGSIKLQANRKKQKRGNNRNPFFGQVSYIGQKECGLSDSTNVTACLLGDKDEAGAPCKERKGRGKV